MSHAAVSRPEYLTFSTTAEAIRARVDAARRMMDVATLVKDAETIRCAAAVALADMAVAGDDLALVTKEYAKTIAAEDCAKAAHQQAVDELLEVRFAVPLAVALSA